MKNKAESIRAMLKAGFCVAEIATLVGVRTEYVRAVRQRMEGGGLSAADRAYIERGGRGDYNRRVAPKRSAYYSARNRALRGGHDKETANAFGRMAYASAPFRDGDE